MLHAYHHVVHVVHLRLDPNVSPDLHMVKFQERAAV